MNEGGADGGEMPRRMSTGLRGLDVEEGCAGRLRGGTGRRREEGNVRGCRCVGHRRGVGNERCRRGAWVAPWR